MMPTSGIGIDLPLNRSKWFVAPEMNPTREQWPFMRKNNGHIASPVGVGKSGSVQVAAAGRSVSDIAVVHGRIAKFALARRPESRASLPRVSRHAI